MQIPWTLPGSTRLCPWTHNCLPGVPEKSLGLKWLTNRGFESEGVCLTMGLRLKRQKPPKRNTAEEARLLAEQGIQVRLWQPGDPTEFDTLCDHVGSEYWRQVLRSELTAWQTGEPNADPALWPDGRRPDGPRPLPVAIADGRIVGFTGPVDREESGRGWFTGLCVDPDYGRRGIGAALFDLLLDQLEALRAEFVTLYTGEDNPARRIYERAGLKPLVRLHIMSLPPREKEQE